jgi:hypothetical protein
MTWLFYGTSGRGTKTTKWLTFNSHGCNPWKKVKNKNSLIEESFVKFGLLFFPNLYKIRSFFSPWITSAAIKGQLLRGCGAYVYSGSK